MRHFSAMIESLETRRLLAGNVTVTDVGGVLSIIGDNKSNQVQITSDVSVTGYQINGLAGTTVNGGASAFFDAHFVARDVSVSMGNGDDVVRWDASYGSF